MVLLAVLLGGTTMVLLAVLLGGPAGWYYVMVLYNGTAGLSCCVGLLGVATGRCC